MSILAGLLGCIGVLGVAGVLERLARDRARRAVHVRVHVNGTRGKSTVTRMIWAALREAGVPAVAKTTGTAPRLLLPDGSERPIVRRAPASIREQLWLLRRARRAGARAVVAECMAVDPSLQWTSEHDMIDATVGVITNTRTDHLESMGGTREEIAHSLANSIPRGGVLVLGDADFADVFRERAAALGTRVVLTGPVSLEAEETSAPPRGDVNRENEATALAVCRELGIDESTALRGIRRAPRDPGSATGGALAVRGRSVGWLDATAANDPESFDTIVSDGERVVQSPLLEFLPHESTAPAHESPARPGSDGRAAVPGSPLSGHGTGALLVVYNHRADRPLRLEAFAQASRRFRQAHQVLITGDVPAWTSMRRLGPLCPRVPFEVVPRKRVAAALAHLLAGGRMPFDHVVFAGNTKALDVGQVLAELAALIGDRAIAPMGGGTPL